jgi:hypothetical protein
MIGASPVSVSWVELAAGSTLLLGLGAVGAAVASVPVHRQRAAELAVVATLLWLATAFVPLPRWSFGVGSGRGAAEPEAPDRGASVAPTWPAATPSVGSANHSLRPAVAPSAGSDAGGASTEVVGRPYGSPASPISGGAFETPHPDLARWLQRAHLSGTVVVGAYVLLGFLLVRRLLRATVAPPRWLAALLADRAARLGVRRVRLRVGGSRRPLTAGLIRPTIVLPAALAHAGRELELRRVIDHELVHVWRRDVLGRLVFAAASPLLWMHPLFWWLRSRAALAAELIADDRAAGPDRRGYARDLLALTGELQALRPTPGHVPGTFRNRSELTRRIAMLTSRHDSLAAACSPRRRALHAGVFIVALGGSVAVLGARPLPAQQEVRVAAPALAAVEGVRTPSAAAAPEARTADVAAAAAAGGAPSAASPAAEASAANEEAAAASAATTATGEPASVANRQMIGVPELQAVARQMPQDPDPGYTATLALVDRALTLQSEVAMAEAELASYQGNVDVGMARSEELSFLTAKIALDGLRRRLQAVQILVATEIEATKLEIQQLDQSMRVGAEGPDARPRLIRLNARLQILDQAR